MTSLEQIIRKVVREELVAVLGERALAPAGSEARPSQSEAEHLQHPQESAVGIQGLASLLAISQDTVRRLARSGGIPSFRVGTAWRFIPSEVIAHLARDTDPWVRSTRSRAALNRRGRQS